MSWIEIWGYASLGAVVGGITVYLLIIFAVLFKDM